MLCQSSIYLSRKRLVIFIAKRLSTIEKCWCYINHHIPTTFGCHGNRFGYVLDNLFTNTMVSSYFLRNVPIPKYLHLCANTHQIAFINFTQGTVVCIKWHSWALVSFPNSKQLWKKPRRQNNQKKTLFWTWLSAIYALNNTYPEDILYLKTGRELWEKEPRLSR